jgi:predicted nucleic acid-binding protein
MVDCLIDTNIIVDLLRGYSPAQIWIATLNKPGISHIVYLEVIQGVSDKKAQRHALQLMKSFAFIEITPTDFNWATQELIKLGLSYGIDAFDCLIAAPSHRLQLPLYTRNMKHFSPLLGALAQKPY